MPPTMKPRGTPAWLNTTNQATTQRTTQTAGPTRRKPRFDEEKPPVPVGPGSNIPDTSFDAGYYEQQAQLDEANRRAAIAYRKAGEQYAPQPWTGMGQGSTQTRKPPTWLSAISQRWNRLGTPTGLGATSPTPNFNVQYNQPMNTQRQPRPRFDTEVAGVTDLPETTPPAMIPYMLGQYAPWYMAGAQGPVPTLGPTGSGGGGGGYGGFGTRYGGNWGRGGGGYGYNGYPSWLMNLYSWNAKV